MNIIKQNPFRILGLTGNATEKELQKQISIIKRYAEIGKSKSFDYDFEFIGDFSRTSGEIQQASNKIEQSHKKLLYSLFWFVKNNQFDDIALKNLKEGDIDKAIEIWNKTLKEEITSKNYSSYLNLSTLYIVLSTIDGQIELQKLQDGIALKGVLIHSERLKDFSKLVTGNGNTNDPVEISKNFVDEVLELLNPYLNKRSGISTNDLINLFNKFPLSVKNYVTEKFTEIPISSIENEIEKSTRKRKDYPSDAVEHGEELYKLTKSDIILLKKLLGSTNMQFQMLADKVANEVLQCSIDFFNVRQKNDSDDKFEENLNKAIGLVKLARSIAVSDRVKNRSEENIKILLEMKDREIYQAIAILSSIKMVYEQAIMKIDVQVMEMSMRMSSNQTINFSKVDKMKANCLDWSKVVRSVNNGISKNDVAIIQLCSNISKVNEYKNLVNFLFSKLGPNHINQLKHLCYWKDIRAIQAKSTAKKVGSTISSATGGGCYIATMAYGDYNHPQVMILREFRDENLKSTVLGRSFIYIYYAISPHLVKLLKNQKYINKIIRKILDQFIKRLK